MRLLCLLGVSFSALLAFSVEPLIAKRLLPAFGGSAAVWVTCLVCFQGLLLLGYLYADRLLRAPRRAQLPLHAAVLLVPLLVLPFRPPAVPIPGASPTGALVIELLRSAALPFFALSTNSTLVQHWYAERTGRPPWFLYAAGNAGSLLGLLGYPLLVEPFVGLAAQSSGWRLGYLAFVVLTGGIALRRRAPAAPLPPATARVPASPPPPRGQVIRWVARSAIGAMLLCAVSFWVTLDVAALPLLWVVPLALYLLTFVLAFSTRVPFPRRILTIVCMLFVILGLESVLGSQEDAGLVLLAALGAIFTGGWIVHGDLARDRPAEDRLSSYYLWIALGGFLGGMAGNLFAPLVFDTVAEYPLALGTLAFALAVERDVAPLRLSLARPANLAAVAGMLAALVLTAAGLRTDWSVYVAQVPVLVLLPGVLLFRRPGLFGAGAALTAAFLAAGLLSTNPVLARDRSFYGTIRIEERDGVRRMVHGTTMHGMERVGVAAPPPAAYYHPQGPLGSSMARFPSGRVGVIGLGAGSLAALARPGQPLDFFEIDPAVAALARRWFGYLDRAPAPVAVELGDARLTLQRRPDGTYSGLFVDAFSSDSIPVHLLTREAVDTYLRKLAPGGAVVFHVSNRFFDLRHVLRGAAGATGAAARWTAWFPDDQLRERELAANTLAVALAREPAALEAWARDGWEPLDPITPVEWTDDHSSLVPLLLRPSSP